MIKWAEDFFKSVELDSESGILLKSRGLTIGNRRQRKDGRWFVKTPQGWYPDKQQNGHGVASKVHDKKVDEKKKTITTTEITKQEPAEEKRRGVIKDLPITEVVEQGIRFKTGESVTFPSAHNTQGADYHGSRFQQDIEVAGKYVTIKSPSATELPNLEYKDITFKNPLVLRLNTGEGSTYDENSWKAALNKKYGKKGKELAEALKADGFDGIVTVGWRRGRPSGTSEIIDLSPGPKRELMTGGASNVTFSGHKLQDRIKYQGMDISIENKAGSYREGTDPNGKKWRSKMYLPYGYIRGTMGADKDHLDAFVGPDPNSQRVYIVKQVRPDTGKFDEDKVMFGFNDRVAARKGYLRHYDSPKYFGSIKEMSMEEFKRLAIEGRKVNL